jgi:hypothetical protein
MSIDITPDFKQIRKSKQKNSYVYNNLELFPENEKNMESIDKVDFY